jgi:hypothetical protein
LTYRRWHQNRSLVRVAIAHDNDCIDVITAFHPNVAAVETPRKQGSPRRAVFRMWMASKAFGCFEDGHAFVCVSDMAFIEG